MCESGRRRCSKSPTGRRLQGSPRTDCCGGGGARPSASGTTAIRTKGSTGFASAPAGAASPLFPPQHENAEQAKEQLEHTLGQPPERFGQSGTRWRLESLRETIAWLDGYSLTGVSACLRRLGVRLKRGQVHLYSPDPDYVSKLEVVAHALAEARASAGRRVLLFADELTFYRQPSVAPVYAPEGRTQPRAEMSQKANTSGRVIGVLDAVTGRVTHLQASAITLATMRRFLRQIVEAYPDAERISIALDNWPVHFHPDVVAVLEQQQNRFPIYLPKSWRAPADSVAAAADLRALE
jgi:hypothetical protein